MERQRQIIDAAIQSQVSINEDRLRKRYANYPRVPRLRERRLTDEDNNEGATPPATISHILVNARPEKPPILAATKWVQVYNNEKKSHEYVRMVQSDIETIDTIDEIDTSPYVLTTYQVNDYVLRRYPPSKIGGGGVTRTSTVPGGVGRIK
jgi:hypothetical protein